MSRIVVIGSGAWGTAIALSLHSRGGHHITLWAHSPEAAREIAGARENTLFLPGFPIPDAIAITGDNSAVREAEIVVSVVPSKFLRPTLARLRSHFHPGQIVVSATKGVEDRTYLRMTQVIAASLAEISAQDAKKAVLAVGRGSVGQGFSPDTTPAELTGALAPEASFSGISPLTLPIGAFSGPSFALEVAQAQPTAVTVAFDDPEVAARIQQEFSSETLRLYTSTDVIGVELGGALKNVIAIACGGRRETLAGLSGVGDLVLTCTGSLSRNRTVGQALGQGRKLPEILESLGGKVAEGVLTTRAALGLARLYNLEMPITEQMELILNEGKDPREAIKDLMLRPGKDEL